RDRSFIDRFGLPGQIASIVFAKGIYEGEYLRTWVGDRLRDHGVEKFADLRRSDAKSALAPEQEFKLVVMASDVSQGRLRRLPWDCESIYGHDADDVAVADAVRASMSIPFFYEPAVARHVKTK